MFNIAAIVSRAELIADAGTSYFLANIRFSSGKPNVLFVVNEAIALNRC